MSRVFLRNLPEGLRLPGQELQPAAPAPKKEKRKKYKNKKVINSHGVFDSKREWERFQVLLKMERAGLISNLRRQVKFELLPGVRLAGEARARPPVRYYADFVYEDQLGREVIEDAKGKQTPEYRTKKHIMKALLNLEILEV